MVHLTMSRVDLFNGLLQLYKADTQQGKKLRDELDKSEEVIKEQWPESMHINYFRRNP